MAASEPLPADAASSRRASHKAYPTLPAFHPDQRRVGAVLFELLAKPDPGSQTLLTGTAKLSIHRLLISILKCIHIH